MRISLSPRIAPSSLGVAAARPLAPRARVSGRLLALGIVAAWAASARGQAWVAQGPGPNTRGQVENIANGEVVGAINAVAPHPTDANIVYIGAVNGGVWRTTNAIAASPSWTQLTDGQASLSIGALEFDPTDTTAGTLVAGIGRASSLIGFGGARTGLLRTTNGGMAWTALNGGGALNGLNVSGVAPRGATIVISVNAADAAANVGIWRSTNTGASWTRLSGTAGSGLPAGRSFDLVGDPANNARLYTNSANGLFRSNDTGATWTKVSSPAMDALLVGASNVRIAVGASNNVYAAIVQGGELAGVFRSGNGGTAWTQMDLPSTSDGGINPGEQGDTHLSLAADRTNAQIVYIGGDRQDSPFPNSIGARDFSGRLFRGDASRPAGSQWVHLTHSRTLGAAGGGTASGSAPHADSRDMDLAANGVLIEVDDGGIYRRTNPLNNTGDWFSMIGNIQTTEFHAVAWDAVSNIVVGGAQDTGSPEQTATSNVRYRSVITADGGVSAVDDTTSATQSVRYYSFQTLGSFQRRTYNASNVLQSQVFPSLVVVSGAPLDPAFYTQIRLNAVTPTRLIIGAANSVYESLDRGDTVREIGPGIATDQIGGDTIAYGATGNPDIVYVGSGAQMFVRTGPSPAPLAQSTAYTGGTVRSVTIRPDTPASAFVIDPNRAFRTVNSGGAWANITGNLGTLTPGSLRSIAFSTHTAAGALIVGSDNGVFSAPGPAFNNWTRLGTGLPRVPIFHLEYDRNDRILVAGTLGRGAWTLNLAGSPGTPSAPDQPVEKSKEESKADSKPEPKAEPEPKSKSEPKSESKPEPE